METLVNWCQSLVDRQIPKQYKIAVDKGKTKTLAIVDRENQRLGGKFTWKLGTFDEDIGGYEVGLYDQSGNPVIGWAIITDNDDTVAYGLPEDEPGYVRYHGLKPKDAQIKLPAGQIDLAFLRQIRRYNSRIMRWYERMNA